MSMVSTPERNTATTRKAPSTTSLTHPDMRSRQNVPQLLQLPEFRLQLRRILIQLPEYFRNFAALLHGVTRRRARRTHHLARDAIV